MGKSIFAKNFMAFDDPLNLNEIQYKFIHIATHILIYKKIYERWGVVGTLIQSFAFIL